VRASSLVIICCTRQGVMAGGPPGWVALMCCRHGTLKECQPGHITLRPPSSIAFAVSVHRGMIDLDGLARCHRSRRQWRAFRRSDRIATLTISHLQLRTSWPLELLVLLHLSPSSKSGYAAMPVYLFRSASSSRSFAYTRDVTGRNIPRETEDAEWLFLRMLDEEQLRAHPEAVQRLRADGFYLFNEEIDPA
jgi:hypothetical protein